MNTEHWIVYILLFSEEMYLYLYIYCVSVKFTIHIHFNIPQNLTENEISLLKLNGIHSPLLFVDRTVIVEFI